MKWMHDDIDSNEINVLVFSFLYSTEKLEVSGKRRNECNDNTIGNF